MRFFIVLIIVVLFLFKFWPDKPVPTAEESFIGPQIQSLNKTESFQQEYSDGLEDKRARMDKEADGL